MKQKKKPLSKGSSTSYSSCRGDGGETPRIRTTSVHPETPEKREALTYETTTPCGHVQASTGHRPHLHRASVRR
jgi:hypothetical protein